MLASLLITLREGLEAALIVGIVLGYLRAIGRMDRQGNVWAGVALALVASLLAAAALQVIGAEFAGTGEQLFEGTAMALAAGILTWMIFWMRTQSRQIKGELEAGIRQAMEAGRDRGLFWLAFVAVVREGLETALFLTAAVFTSSATETVSGGIVGLALAVVVGWMFFAGTARLNVARFFQVTSVLLVVFAAGLVSNAVHEFQEAGLIPVVIEHLWNSSALLAEGSALGQALHSLVGYSAAPSLVEVLSYLGYYLVLWLGIRRGEKPRVAHATALR
jgi:high-affinity iron transporter